MTTDPAAGYRDAVSSVVRNFVDATLGQSAPIAPIAPGRRAGAGLSIMNRRLYALHRWISLIALLQLLVVFRAKN